MIKLFKQMRRKEALMALLCAALVVGQVWFELRLPDYILEGWCDASVGLDLEKHARTVCDILQKVKDGDTSSVEKLTKAYSIWMCTSENLQGILDGTAEKVYYEY